MKSQKMIQLGKQSSIIRELFEYGKQRKKLIGEDKVFDFSIGNPSVPAPKEVNEKLIELLTNTDSVELHGYTSSAGDLETRNAIATHLNKKYHCQENGEYIYLTIGAAAGLSISFNALINEGDEVIVFAPFWPEYKVLVEQAGGKVVVVKPDNSFLPDFDDLKSKINCRTKMVIINSPNNPTGVIYKEDTLVELSKILNDAQNKFKQDIYLLSDEPYRDLIYVDTEYPFITNYYDNSIVTYSFSKSLSLPGERIGYILVGNKTNNKDDVYASIVGSGRALGFVCAVSLFQKLIPSVLNVTTDINVYNQNKEYLYSKLTELGYEVIYPEGAFYLFVKALENDSYKFMEVAKQYELLLVPSDSFGVKGYVRVAYCVSFDQIKNSIDAFKKLMIHYQGE